RARARLVGVDRELVVMLAVDDRVGCGDDRLRHLGLDDAELAVHDRGGALHARERDDLCRLEAGARDREVLNGALGLCAIQSRGRNPDLTHGVVLDAVFGLRRSAHCSTSFSCSGVDAWMSPTTKWGTARPSTSR